MGCHTIKATLIALAFAVQAHAQVDETSGTGVGTVSTASAALRPAARTNGVPRTRWERLSGSDVWTRTAASALRAHGQGLLATTPEDISDWCPGYVTQDPSGKEAFWVGLMSTLAKHESTYRPAVSGDSGQSHGLLQIRTATASEYGCRAASRDDLYQPSENLSCAVRIMARNVVRDGRIAGQSGRWQGMAADWGPFRVASKREDMRRWMLRQPYCTALSDLRPAMRPVASDSN